MLKRFSKNQRTTQEIGKDLEESPKQNTLLHRECRYCDDCNRNTSTTYREIARSFEKLICTEISDEFASGLCGSAAVILSSGDT